MTVKPLSPRDLETRIAELRVMPDFVIEEVNKLLIKYYKSGAYSGFKQKELVANIKARIGSQKFEDWWLDFEPNYRAQGWKVTYDKPGYNETYDATYQFEKAWKGGG